MPTARPFVKSAGGKTKSLPHLLEVIPKKFDTYFEPFIGGGALFFELAQQKRFRRAVLNDANERLGRTWRAVRDSVEAVIQNLFELAQTHTEEQYYRIRALEVDSTSDVEVATWFIYMNKTCFNGLYRVNQSGKFNVPLGSYKKPKICDAESLRAAAIVLQGVDITVEDFRGVEALAHAGDVVYCDPPYVPLSDTSEFTRYTKNGFDMADQTRLRDVAVFLKERGVHVVLSNHDTPVVRELYHGFELSSIGVARAINSDGDLRDAVAELVIR